jgi:shikimate dehydrogenase
MLKTEGIEVLGKSVLVLGAGGAARAVVYELLKEGALVTVYSRTYEKVVSLVEDIGTVNGNTAKALQELDDSQSYNILINSTGVGMHNTVGVSPVSEELIKGCDVAIDLIYEPKKSEFLRLAEGKGKRILNGEGMLFYQAYIAECYYWNLPTGDTERAKELFLLYQKEV